MIREGENYDIVVFFFQHPFTGVIIQRISAAAPYRGDAQYNDKFIVFLFYRFNEGLVTFV
jgi:hypothetical protein